MAALVHGNHERRAGSRRSDRIECDLQHVYHVNVGDDGEPTCIGYRLTVAHGVSAVGRDRCDWLVSSCTPYAYTRYATCRMVRGRSRACRTQRMCAPTPNSSVLPACRTRASWPVCTDVYILTMIGHDVRARYLYVYHHHDLFCRARPPNAGRGWPPPQQPEQPKREFYTCCQKKC